MMRNNMTMFIERIEVEYLYTGSDVSGEYTTSAKIDAFLAGSITFECFGTKVVIDRLRFVCPGQWCSFSTYEVAVVFAGPKYELEGIPVHPRLLARLYQALKKEKKCEQYDFKEDFNELVKIHGKAIYELNKKK